MARDQKLFALWDHGDTMLGGPVMEFTDEGYVRVENYGGSMFKPALVLPAARGAIVLAEFEALREQRDAARRVFEGTWNDRYEALLDKHGIKR